MSIPPHHLMLSLLTTINTTWSFKPKIPKLLRYRDQPLSVSSSFAPLASNFVDQMSSLGLPLKQTQFHPIRGSNGPFADYESETNAARCSQSVMDQMENSLPCVSACYRDCEN